MAMRKKLRQPKTPYVRMHITVPTALYKIMSIHFGHLNWSEVATEAFWKMVGVDKPTTVVSVETEDGVATEVETKRYTSMQKSNPSEVRHLIDNNPVPLLLIFVGANCPHSSDLKESLKDLHKHTRDGVDVAYLDVSDDPLLGIAYGVEATPTSLLLQRGSVVHKWVGVYRFHQYYDAVQSLLASTPVDLMEQLHQEEGAEDSGEEVPF